MPIISDIQEQKKNKTRSSIFVDGSFFVGASNFVIKQNRLEIGKEVDKQILHQIIIDDSVEKAKGYIIDYHLNKTKKMIRNKLSEKGYEEEVIERVMDFIEMYNLVDDADYAVRKTHDALHIGKKGKRVIYQTLKQNGVPEEHIQEALDNINYSDQVDVAKKAIRSKIAPYKQKAKNHYEFKNKCYVFLTRRGFTGDIINEVMADIEKGEKF